MLTIMSSLKLMKRKHFTLAQSKIDRARKLPGVTTEEEAIELALDLVLGEEPIVTVPARGRPRRGFTDAPSPPGRLGQSASISRLPPARSDTRRSYVGPRPARSSV